MLSLLFPLSVGLLGILGPHLTLGKNIDYLNSIPDLASGIFLGHKSREMTPEDKNYVGSVSIL